VRSNPDRVKGCSLKRAIKRLSVMCAAKIKISKHEKGKTYFGTKCASSFEVFHLAECRTHR
jgi:hypothetical protein